MKSLAAAVAMRAAGALAISSSTHSHWEEVWDRCETHDRRPETRGAPFAERVLEHEAMQRDVRAALHKLTLRQHFILACRFGLLDNNELTLEEVGERLHVTREYVRQIQVKALRRLSLGACAPVLFDWWHDLPGRDVGHSPVTAGWRTDDADSIEVATCHGCLRDDVPLCREASDGLNLCALCFREGLVEDMREAA